ncbi:MAG: hypothetical protein A3F83_14270 [Candidatus Glassbacteria bacterium RIFCSPLOWO2_12_FULL_58_11]|uniref:Uncharacterized protein n=1 Tax=Candidatus Glassbacteria bacterium RIFCSPLOWO2_12_FULL_58_11 TaxID=1817867 RepID=A0A1F5Z2D2_9BACT|nr:MAG: hypothetical protein A3F83_14270 [Candidatus Glassbacteria bacterium RIFCSPLOWO2_12_FULL_58_11]
MTLQGISPLIDTLSAQQVSSYLLRKGWKAVDYSNSNLLVFSGTTPDTENLSIVLPAKQTFADFPAKLRDCVNLLSELYSYDAQTIVHHIAHWDRDVLKIRLESPLKKEQLLPLDYASKMIALYNDFVAFAAATEKQHRRFFAKLPADGRKFADSCMFGHTFVGSFGLTIECPLDLTPELPMPNLPQPRPFKRKVTERIATAYVDLATAVQKDDPEVIVRNNTVGFSGNMCEILADIYEMSEGRTVSQSIIWAPELPPPQNLLTVEKGIPLDQKSCNILKAASDLLHTVEEPEKEKEIIGRVTFLRSEQPPVNTEEFAIASRTIAVLWEVEKAQPLHIRIELPIDLYRKACDAHKFGKKVRIYGKPRKTGKYWTLLDQHNFEVI